MSSYRCRFLSKGYMHRLMQINPTHYMLTISGNDALRELLSCEEDFRVALLYSGWPVMIKTIKNSKIKLAYTGSTATEKVVLELTCKSNLKPVTLELGGKSPFIVREDAGIDKDVELAHFALFFNQDNVVLLGLAHLCMSMYMTSL